MIISDLINEVAREFEVSSKELIGHSRYRSIMKARFALYKVLVARGSSRARAGKVCGGRDHTTIMYGMGQAELMAFKDPEYKAKIERLISFQPEPLSLKHNASKRSHHMH